MANRVREVIGDIIHTDQTYCIPNRSIFDNVYLIKNILDVSSLLNIDTGLISLDQEKAFNRVEHLYLWNMLEGFGFDKSFIDIIKVLYQDIESVLKVNGGLSGPFKISRGIRQGCALSGMLYAMSIEPLLVRIRNKIEGWDLPFSGISFKLCAYADDIVVLIKDQKDLEFLQSIIKDFSLISSAKINWTKSEAAAFGNWEKGLPTLPGGLSWNKKGFKYLGVYLGNSEMLQKKTGKVLWRKCRVDLKNGGGSFRNCLTEEEL